MPIEPVPDRVTAVWTVVRTARPESDETGARPTLGSLAQKLQWRTNMCCNHNERPLRAWWWTLGAVALWGCGGPDAELTNQGKLCLYANPPESPGMAGPAQDFLSDQPIYVSVSTEECISACVEQQEASCWVALDGQVVSVESVLAWNEPSRETACIALCGSVSAVCSSPPLAAGQYTVVHGEHERMLAIPSTDIPPCAD